MQRWRHPVGERVKVSNGLMSCRRRCASSSLAIEKTPLDLHLNPSSILLIDKCCQVLCGNTFKAYDQISGVPSAEGKSSIDSSHSPSSSTWPFRIIDLAGGRTGFV